MRVFALYLPQFHEIPENNMWWGKGFTEWKKVKEAKPLYKGHYQPKVPENKNYYNLLDKSTIEWQTNLMKSAGVDGMIYYHYYFKGKKLLEKPAENLLKWKDIDQPFFFCWANHTWNRAWNGSRETLIEQTYGDQHDWKIHFNYLREFFRDTRYEKVNNKPIFMIYQPFFTEKNEMLECFDLWARNEGFDGIYVIEVCSECSDQYITNIKNNASVATEKFYLTEPRIGRNLYDSPSHSKIILHCKGVIERLRQKGILKTVRLYDGEKIYQEMINKEPYSDEYIHGVFFEWDNTPRHGYRGYIINPPTKQTYMQYINKIKNNDYIFINAWNEWAEGMMLEPTEQNKGKYLDWVAEIKK